MFKHVQLINISSLMSVLIFLKHTHLWLVSYLEGTILFVCYKAAESLERQRNVMNFISFVPCKESRGASCLSPFTLQLCKDVFVIVLYFFSAVLAVFVSITFLS